MPCVAWPIDTAVVPSFLPSCSQEGHFYSLWFKNPFQTILLQEVKIQTSPWTYSWRLIYRGFCASLEINKFRSASQTMSKVLEVFACQAQTQTLHSPTQSQTVTAGNCFTELLQCHFLAALAEVSIESVSQLLTYFCFVSLLLEYLGSSPSLRIQISRHLQLNNIPMYSS